jgi:hypothetical protein
MTAAHDWFAASSQATKSRPTAVARLLRTSNRYALLPFAEMQTEAGRRLGIALEPPPTFDVDAVQAWQPVGDIVFVDPVTGQAELSGDGGGWIVGDIPNADTVSLYTNGLSFARDWATQRVAWLDLHRAADIPGLAISEPQDNALPGLLLAGPLNRVCSWLPLLDRARIVVDDPAMVRPLKAALLRAKCVPIVEAIAPRNRKVAA